MAAITYRGESLIASKQANGEHLNIDRIVLANIPGLDPSQPVDRNEQLPPADQIVLDDPISQHGYINPNLVVYSLHMGTGGLEFDFNWLGLYSEKDDVVIAITYLPTQSKDPSLAMTRNFMLEFSGAAETTDIHIDAESWQVDFSARMEGTDGRARQMTQDVIGRQLFYGDACKVVKGSGGYYDVLPGDGYVAGIRFNYPGKSVLVSETPTSVWLDVSQQGNAMSDIRPVVEVILSADELTDYIDSNNTQHYLEKISDLNNDGIIDLRLVNLRSPSGVTHPTLLDAINDDNSFRDYVKIGEYSGVRYRRAVNQNEYDKHPPKGKFKDRVNGLFVLDAHGSLLLGNLTIDQSGDCSDALASALKVCNHIVLDKSYNIASVVIDIDSDCVITGGELNIFGDSLVAFQNATTRELDNVVSLPKYRESQITLDDVVGIEAGDFITIHTSTIAETQWNTARYLSASVSHVDGNVVHINSTAKFDFHDADEPRVYHSKRIKLTLKDVRINTEGIDTLGRGFLFSYLSVDCSGIGQMNSDLTYSMRFAHCVDCSSENISAANGIYPLLLNGGTNFRFKHLSGNNVSHMVVPAAFTDGVWVDGIKGSGAIIESHPAFNVNYTNFECFTGGKYNPGYANLRSIGGSLRNGCVSHVGEKQKNGPYLQSLALVDQRPYEDATFTMDDVDWYSQPLEDGTYPSCVVQQSSNVILNNVRAGGSIAFSAGVLGKVDRVSLNNVTSKIGIISGRGTKSIINTCKEFNPILKDGRLALDARAPGVSETDYSIKGVLSKARDTEPEPKIIPVRFWPASRFNGVHSFYYATLKICLALRHSNSGGFNYLEHTYAIRINFQGAGAATIGPKPIYSSQPSELPNEESTISIDVVNFSNGSGNENKFVDLDISVSSEGRANPIFSSVRYELDVTAENEMDEMEKDTVSINTLDFEHHEPIVDYRDIASELGLELRG